MPTPDKNFQKIVEDLLPKLMKQQAAALRNKAQRPPDSLGSSTATPYDATIESIKKFFDRSDAGIQYLKSVASDDKDHNTINIKMAAKAQSDMLARLERDVLAQSTSRIRLCLFEASRRDRLGGGDGAIIKNLANSVRSLYTISGGAQ